VIPQIFALTRIIRARKKRGSLPDVAGCSENCGRSRPRKFEFDAILHVDQIKAGWRRCRANQRAITCHQHFADPRNRAFSPTDLQQAANDISHHVLQKGVRGDIDNDQVVESSDGDRKHASIW